MWVDYEQPKHVVTHGEKPQQVAITVKGLRKPRPCKDVFYECRETVILAMVTLQVSLLPFLG